MHENLIANLTSKDDKYACAIAKKQKAKIEERIKKISRTIRCLYEDRVVGRISV